MIHNDSTSILLDGHQSIDRDLVIHYEDSHYGMGEHKAYTRFRPWHI